MTMLMTLSLTAQAQFKMHPNGKLSVLTEETPLSPISFNGPGFADILFGVQGQGKVAAFKATKPTGNWSYASNFMNSGAGTNSSFVVGAMGSAYADNNTQKFNGRAYGLMGTAQGATPGWNYGVFGKIGGQSYGAALYGTINNDNGSYIPGRYAGYFNGPVYIGGQLTVTGAINGVIIGPAADSNSNTAASSFSSSETVAEKLTGLNAIAFYKNNPATASATEAGDTTHTENKPSAIEIQDISKQHYALSAEQLEAIYPELVYEKEDGTKGINYMEMIPLLVQSIGELKAEIAQLKGLPAKASTRTYDGNTNGVDRIAADVASIEQNEPNPFTEKTTIRFSVPSKTKNALLCVYDMNGKQLRQIALSSRGRSSVTIAGSELSAGMYLYCLIVDGKLINTRRMVLTK